MAFTGVKVSGKVRNEALRLEIIARRGALGDQCVAHLSVPAERVQMLDEAQLRIRIAVRIKCFHVAGLDMRKIQVDVLAYVLFAVKRVCQRHQGRKIGRIAVEPQIEKHIAALPVDETEHGVIILIRCALVRTVDIFCTVERNLNADQIEALELIDHFVREQRAVGNHARAQRNAVSLAEIKQALGGGQDIREIQQRFAAEPLDGNGSAVC